MNPLELVDYLAAGTALLIGVCVGRRMRPKQPEPLKPVCSCEHGFGAHEDGRRCHSKVNAYRNGVTYREACECQRYDGPDPAIFGLEVGQ